MDGDLGLPKKGGVIALERGLAILMAFNFAKDALRLTDLAKITGLNKSTVLRLCTSLERQGFVKRREDG
ncbi:MAG: helix-turn-helix domain-containing protein, partial [Rhodospirillales bacterium]|nr:helix-turn-helix domain-containing protein [Rhodospirillales bacterium]